MSDTKEIKVMRCMAWERAKGELMSMQHTFYSSSDYSSSEQNLDAYKELKKLTSEFIKAVEDKELQYGA